MDYKEVENGWFYLLKEFMLKGKVWFVTLSFKFNVERPVAERNVKEWLRRLRQVLHIKEDEMEVYAVFDYQVREVFHVHLLVKANGLFSLKPSIWEDKWFDVSNLNHTAKIVLIDNTSNDIEGFCNHKNDASKDEEKDEEEQEEFFYETEESYLAVMEQEDRKKPKKKHNGYLFEGYDEEEDDDEFYQPEKVAGYLLARHSHEITASMEFWGGQRKRA